MPHIQPIGAIFFVTFRLYDSLPKAVIDEYVQQRKERISQILSSVEPDKWQKLYEEQKRQFGIFDDYLDRCTLGEHWLKSPDIAKVVVQALHFFENKRYDLICYCIMSNHVHLVLDLGKQLEEPEENYRQLYEILKTMKGFSARQCNLLLGRKGSFWQKESYDHWVRDDLELGRIIRYILDNPVKIGLIEHWSNWPFSFVAEKYKIWL
jgi:REP element-mobilizing transposase RayT